MTEPTWPEHQPQLSDGTIVLRPWTSADADSVHDACQDPEIQRWTTVPEPFVHEDARSFVGPLSKEAWASKQHVPFCISTFGGEVLGSCSIVRLEASDLVAEIGYWVATTARGNGVAVAAASLLAEWALNTCGFRRLEFYIEPANAASVGVVERLGAEREGVLRSKTIREGQSRDLALYAIIA